MVNIAEEDPPLAGSRDFPPPIPQYAGPLAGLTADQPLESFPTPPRFDLTFSNLRIPLAIKFFNVN